MQSGLLRWTLARYAPTYHVAISPNRTTRAPSGEPDEVEERNASDTLPLPDAAETAANVDDASAIPPAPALPMTPVANSRKVKAKGRNQKTAETAESDESDDEGVLPTPFTPSIYKVLKPDPETLANLPPLPCGLTVDTIRRRLSYNDKMK